MGAADHDRLTDLWDRHADQVYAYGRRRVGVDDAPDVVAEVFAVAVAHPGKVPDDALPWLYRTAWNVISNLWRTNERRTRPVPIATDAGDVGIEVVERAALFDALATLSDADREAPPNPVPYDRVDGWSQTPEGQATRARVASSRPMELQRGSRSVRAVAVAAAVVLALVMSVLLIRGGGDTPTPTATRPVVERLAHGKWKELDPGPARDLTFLSSVWTGQRLIALGYRGAATAPEGSSYDPRTNRWTKIARPPDGVRKGAVVVWVGTEMLVWSGNDPSSYSAVARTDGIAYDPRTDEWRAVSPAPIFPGDDTIATWTGHVLFVTNGSQAASYDPDTDRWTTEPEPPISLSGNESTRAVWTGRDVVYVVPSGTVADRAALAFDTERHMWIRFSPPFETGSFGTAGLVRDGHTVAAIEWNATAPDVDPELRWSRLQVPPKPSVPGPRALRHPSICSIEASPVPRGAAVFCDRYHFVGLDFSSGEWRRFPAAPDPLPRTVTWTGRELLAFNDQQLLALEPAAR